MRYAMIIDTKKCVGCCDCVVACQTENDVPLGNSRDWVKENLTGKYPKLEREIRSERCNHCENSPCVRCCPTSASHYDEGGIVMVNGVDCIGCGACIQSCPYKARYTHPKGYVDKCTFCLHRIRKGEDPACVAVCPTNTMYFGDLNDSSNGLSEMLKKRKYKVLAPEAGTGPQVYYLI